MPCSADKPALRLGTAHQAAQVETSTASLANLLFAAGKALEAVKQATSTERAAGAVSTNIAHAPSGFRLVLSVCC